MRSIAIMNQKGGVGKTTTSVNLAAALARRGKSVCLIDLDPQANSTQHFGVAEQDVERESIYDVLIENKPLASVRRQVADNLWLVPSHIDLAGAETLLYQMVARELVLKKKLAADTAPFDFLLIDCPPSLSILTLNALTAVGEVLIALQPHFFSMSGLSQLLKTIDVVVDNLNPDLRICGAVFCLYDGSTRIAAEVTDEVSAYFEQCAGSHSVWTDARIFKTRIRRNVRLVEASSYGKSIFDFDPNSNGAEDYGNLAQELLGESDTRHPSAP